MFSALCVITFALCGIADAAAPEGGVKIKLDAATREKMSIFISNFTEVDLFEIETPAAMRYGDFVYFGAMHLYLNSPKTVKRMKDDRVSVDGKAVFRAAEKYFSLGDAGGFGSDLVSARYNGIAFDCQGGAYIFKTPADRVIYYADVKEAYDVDDLVLMIGSIYEKANRKNVTGPFYAWAEPKKYEGRDTWALLSIRRGEYDGSSFGADMETMGEVPREIILGDNETLVRSAEEFVAALGSDKTIVLDGSGCIGSEFNLSAAADLSGLPEGVAFAEDPEGRYLVVEGLKNLTIRLDGQGGGAVFTTRGMGASTLAFRNCRNLKIEGQGLSVRGKSKKESYNVLSFYDCENVALDGFEICEGGTSGLDLMRVKGFKMTDSSISKVSGSALVIEDSENAAFVGCTFMGNDSDTPHFVVEGSKNITFDDCVFYESDGVGFKISESSGITVNKPLFKGCDFSGFDPSGLVAVKDAVYYE